MVAQRAPILVKDPEGDKGWRGARKRFIENYLSAANMRSYSALMRSVLGPIEQVLWAPLLACLWEDFRDALSRSSLKYQEATSRTRDIEIAYKAKTCRPSF